MSEETLLGTLSEITSRAIASIGEESHQAAVEVIPPQLTHDYMTPLHEQICLCIAAGISTKQIAEATRLNPSTISQLRNRLDVRERVRVLQIGIGIDAVKKRFETLIPTAVDVAEELMLDSKTSPSVRANIAFEFMNRHLGKPTEKHEHSGNLLSDLITKLNREQSPHPFGTPPGSTAGATTLPNEEPLIPDATPNLTE